MQICALHLSRRIQHPRAFDVAADLDNSGPFKTKIRLALSGPQIDGEPSMGGHQRLLSFSWKMAGVVEEPEPHLSLAADLLRRCALSRAPTEREQAREQRADGE